jgi:hypothetical protein
MTDTPKAIPPALSDAEWKSGTEEGQYPLRLRTVTRTRYSEPEREVVNRWCNTGADIPLTEDELRATVAMCNAALPPDDPHKITREWVVDLRAAAYEVRESSREASGSEWDRLNALADRLYLRAEALASYLTPETP